MSPRRPTGKPVGRPRIDAPRRHVDSVRTSDTERKQLLAAATAEGMQLGPWLREMALRAARRTLARQQRQAPDQH